MNRNLTIAAIAAISLIVGAAKAADMNLAPIQPANPGFGQKAQFSVLLSEKGKPIKNARIEFWFSGIKGIRTSSWAATTNAEGRATFTRDIPRDWKGRSWVDLNASCDSAAILKLWRVRGK